MSIHEELLGNAPVDTPFGHAESGPYGSIVINGTTDESLTQINNPLTSQLDGMATSAADIERNSAERTSSSGLSIAVGEQDRMEAAKRKTEGDSDPASLLYTVVQRIQYFVVTGIVTISVAVVFHGISMDYCVLQFNPAVLFVVLFLALTLLAYVEALHYSNVSVEKWDMTKFESRHFLSRALLDLFDLGVLLNTSLGTLVRAACRS
jgi:hypothetical protein